MKFGFTLMNRLQTNTNSSLFWKLGHFHNFQAKLNVAPSEGSHLTLSFKIFSRFIIFSPLTYLLLSISALSEQTTPSPASFLGLRERIPYKM